MNIPKKIGQFTRYIGNPTTMKYGYYYQCVFHLPLRSFYVAIYKADFLKGLA